MDTGSRLDWTEPVYDHRRRGTYIISTSDGRRSHMHTGCWVSPVSHRPPRLGIAMAKEMEGAEIVARGGRIGLSLVAENQKELLVRFIQGAYTPERMGSEEIFWGLKTGVPLLTHAVTVFECWLDQIIDLGDFLWVIGETVTAEARETGPDLLVNDIGPVPKARMPVRGYDDVRGLPARK
ncbi:MAG: flavin reductase family protein [Thermaerobacter sp.]|nr:flavin reductase family protein [Thermaerobacter sp.]